MCFEYNKLVIKGGRASHHVWQRDPLAGNRVIVVIDDECGVARQNSKDILDPQLSILPLLRETACQWQETRAIGFFRLMGTKDGADKVLKLIDEWLEGITDSNTQIYFLVDLLYGQGIAVAANHMIEKLTSSYSHSEERIAYLTRAAARKSDVENEDESTMLLPGYKAFRKAPLADYTIEKTGKFRPDLMKFLDMM